MTKLSSNTLRDRQTDRLEAVAQREREKKERSAELFVNLQTTFLDHGGGHHEGSFGQVIDRRIWRINPEHSQGVVLRMAVCLILSLCSSLGCIILVSVCLSIPASMINGRLQIYSHADSVSLSQDLNPRLQDVFVRMLIP